jgi:hypothetical protein
LCTQMDCFFQNGSSSSGSQHSYHMQVESVFMTYGRSEPLCHYAPTCIA